MFIQKHYPVIVGRQRQYHDDLKSKNRKCVKVVFGVCVHIYTTYCFFFFFFFFVKVGKTFSSIAASLLILLYAAIYKG